ncbi:MAG: leucyl aminopeptidase family protein, partial [Dehalococcoidales bacterium]|nr:leucyl aminopeptidase family protein [Dehalococcoidales bacterium]
MEIKVIAGDATRVETGAIVIGFFKDTESLDGDLATIDKVLDGAISRLVSQGEVKGKTGEITVVHGLGKLSAARVVIVGLGKREELTLDRIRGTVAEACRYLQRKGIADVAVVDVGGDAIDITKEVSTRTISEGALLGVYTFRKHITKEAEHGEIKTLTIISKSKEDICSLEQGIEKGRILAEAANLARDMVNEPANYMTPTD